MPRANITAKWIAGVSSPATGRVTHTDEVLKGFAVVVTATGKKSYYRVGRVGKSVTRTKLGDWPSMAVEEARRRCQRANVDAADGINPRSKREKPEHTLGDVWDWYWVNRADGQLKEAPKLKRDWNRLFARTWAAHSLSTITRPMILELQTSLRTIGPGAVNRATALLKSLFRTASENGWLHVPNPMTGIKLDYIASRDRFVLPSEIQAFFEGLSKLRQEWQDVFQIALFTGARRSNVTAMKWQDIDRDNLIWIIPASVSKNKHAIRLPLSTLVRDIINRRWETRTHPTWVFPSRLKKGSHLTEPKRAWARLLRESKLTDLRLHDLRRTLASWQALAGTSLITIGKTLGHKSLSSTAIYARLHDDAVRESVQTITESLHKAGLAKKSENDPK